jgi:CDP-glycerol glycerophosphotransferase (TagB/SpsB family)
VFGSWSGKLVGDNGGALFEYVSQLPRGPRCVWISADPRIVRHLRAKGLSAELRSSLAGWRICAKAGVYLYDGLTRDINHWVSRGATKVLLRHGVGIKRIERSINNPTHKLFKLFHGNWLQRARWAFLIPWHLSKPDWALATSPEHAKQAVQFFGIDEDQVWVTGFPRYDKMMLGKRAMDGPGAAVVAEMERSDRPTFLFMPTFRDHSSPVGSLWERLHEQAARADVQLFVKLHFVDSQRGALPSPEERSSWPRISWVDPEAEPTDLYGGATGLITDYSSVAFDMMLLGKPVIYFIPDLASYVEEDRSLLYPIDEVTPGPKCRSFDELGDALIAASTSGMGPWAADYELVKRRFHTYTDGKACLRVYETLTKQLGLRFAASENGQVTGGPITKSDDRRQIEVVE